tara:strand:- start:35 stop:823 length:789 start_codon:yes stop_codon:yes gene_type:complete
LTYGYLGNIARQARLCQKNIGNKPYRNIIIVDHGFGPEELRNGIYRLVVHDQHARGIQFSTGGLLSHRHQNAIHQHLKLLQSNGHLRLMGLFSGEEKKEIALFVEPAPVLVSLQLKKNFNPDSYAETFKQRADDTGLQLFRSFKRLEIDLTPDGERQKTINSADHVSIESSQIKLAACPTSMLALSLILKGIPVELSPIHPLIDQIGPTVPALKQHDALELVFNTITQTTFSIKNIRRIENALSKFNPMQDIQKNIITINTN